MCRNKFYADYTVHIRWINRFKCTIHDQRTRETTKGWNSGWRRDRRGEKIDWQVKFRSIKLHIIIMISHQNGSPIFFRITISHRMRSADIMPFNLFQYFINFDCGSGENSLWFSEPSPCNRQPEYFFYWCLSRGRNLHFEPNKRKSVKLFNRLTQFAINYARKSVQTKCQK